MISQDLSYSVTTLHSFKHEWLSFFEVSHADERQHHNHIFLLTLFLRWQKSYYTPWNFDKFSPINLMSGGALVPTLQSIAQLQEDTIRGLVLKGESFYHSKSRSQCKVTSVTKNSSHICYGIQ